MLAEALSVEHADSALWQALRPLVEVALRLEQEAATSSWRGWQKQSIETFLKGLPDHCALLVGVWEDGAGEGTEEMLYLACACEVRHGEVIAVRCLDALDGPEQRVWEPGIQHGLEMMRMVRSRVAPVAWALFTDKATWDEWLFTTQEDEGALDKGALLVALTHQGRCVILGNGHIS